MRRGAPDGVLITAMDNGAAMKVLPVIVLIICLTVGCSTKVTQENYAKLYVGMTYGEVIEIFGPADSCDAVLTAKHCVWKDGNKQIAIQFLGEKVILFSGMGF
jgi:hypothetical protein